MFALENEAHWEAFVLRLLSLRRQVHPGGDRAAQRQAAEPRTYEEKLGFAREVACCLREAGFACELADDRRAVAPRPGNCR